MSDFKEWYEKNADGWNEKRRSRYNDDAKYRETVLERNRKHRSEKKQAQQVELKEVRQAQTQRVKSRWKTFDDDADGQRRFSIGALAERLGVSVQAIRLWERQGVIPPPAKRTVAQRGSDGKGQRLYALAEIEKIRKILKEQGRLPDVGSDDLKDKVRGYEREIVFPNGKTKTEQVYTVGVLASAVTRTVVTLEHLERKGYLPPTPLRGSSVGRRLYTKPMIETVKKAFDKRPSGIRGGTAWKSFFDEVLQGWKKIGIVGAALKDQ